MSQKNRVKRNRRLVWVIALVLILAGGGGYAYYQLVYLPAQNPTGEQATLQTATARTGNLTLSASGTGTLITATDIQFGFETSGQVTALYVKPGDVVEAVRHARTVLGEIRRLTTMAEEELMAYAKEIGAPYELVKETKELGRMPVVNFAAGGVATPADAALMMQLGVDGVFVGSGIFKSGDPARRERPPC